MDLYDNTLRNSFKAKLARFFAPGYSCCRMCGMPWKYVKHHRVNYDDDRGFFTMCEKCWPLVSLDDRIESVSELVHEWARQDPFNIDQIKERLPKMIAAIRAEAV